MNRLPRWGGPVIGVFGALFVIRELSRNWDEVRLAIATADMQIFALALLVGFVAITLLGIVWRYCLWAVGHQVGPLDALNQYFVGQLGKYIPGGIWPIVGRAEMARRSGADRPTAYWATVLAMGLTYLAAILISLAALLGGADRESAIAWQPVIALLPIGIVALHPRVLALFMRGLRRLTGSSLEVIVPRWPSSLGLLIAYVPAWLGISAATVLVAVGLVGPPLDIPNLVFATTLSWTIGFLVVPVPGGIGVREAAFIAAATSLPAGLAAVVAIVARFLFVVIDAGGAGITASVFKLMQEESMDATDNE